MGYYITQNKTKNSEWRKFITSIFLFLYNWMTEWIRIGCPNAKLKIMFLLLNAEEETISFLCSYSQASLSPIFIMFSIPIQFVIIACPIAP